MRTRMIWIVALVASAPFAFAWFALAARTVIRAPMDERSLEVSVDNVAAFGLIAGTECTPALTRCMVYDDSGGGATYAVTARNRSCWDARLIDSYSAEVVPPSELSGCVRLWQWSVL
ncbi:hypothetical protein DVA67_002270 [Solirubrobacter sp. CPCC 204708]|uniref:DUF4333 domain-containing protein n=1 Tax=Solirubrobacter deserti TaxID=2282478 RepID=A0ABT4RRJ2_9ACTN|nr:hypothetical protein [Solirubrobacter deserti]MBE2314785.1 hypothetical protein [Solirubrobacter deserti]MDA0141195.1 hypothetical protein [Solirubrobacter deserti]